MRLLLGAGSPRDDLGRDDLVALHAHPDPLPATGWVRTNFVASVDGAVSGADGLSASLQTPADQAVFSVLRALADVVVAGAGTVRAEGYPARLDVKRWAQDARRGDGQQPAPCLAVVTSSGSVPDALLSAPGRDDDGWHLVVLAAAAAGEERLGRLRAALGEECVVVAGDGDVDPHRAVAALVERGLPRVLCEGGPRLMARWVGAGRVDEMFQTTAPLVVGGDGRRVLDGPAVDAAPWHLAHLLEQDGTLLARWLAA
jgi:riboflavin biosynthesis pyrimidine reductase